MTAGAPRRPGPRARLIRHGSCAFRVLESGPPDPGGEPVVLLHGVGMSHRYLARLHERIAASRRVLSVDLPGFGGLPKPGSDVDVPAMAALLARTLRELRLGPAVVVGHSMGAQWAVELGRLAPDLVARVVAIGPVVDPRHRTFARQALALAVDTLREPPGANAIVYADYLRCGVRWYLAQVRHMLAYPIERVAGELRMPLRVVRGGCDPVAGAEWSRRLRDAATAGELVTIPGRPHVVQRAAPVEVAAAVLREPGAG